MAIYGEMPAGWRTHNVSMGGEPSWVKTFEKNITPPKYNNYDEEDEVESLASAGPLGGVEADDYMLDTLHELFEEALHDLK